MCFKDKHTYTTTRYLKPGVCRKHTQHVSLGSQHMKVRQATEENGMDPVEDKWFRSPKSGVPRAMAVAEQEDMQNGA